MNILLFGDTHGLQTFPELLEKSKHVDLCICLGDFTRGGENTISTLEKINTLQAEVLLIHGNHEKEQIVRNTCKQKSNITYIHRNIVERDNYMILGYGGEGFSFTTKDFESFIRNNKDILKHKKYIFATHQPPRHTDLDLVGERHVGNNSFRTFIDAHNPILSASGHIHENEGITQQLRETTLVNPGPTGYIITV